MAINLKKAWLWLINFFKKAGEHLEEPAAIAVRIVNSIKAVLDNPALDLFAQLTATKIDDMIIDIIRKYLPGVLKGLMVGSSIVGDLATGNINALLLKFSDLLKSLNHDDRGNKLSELAARLLPYIVGQPNMSLAVARPATSVQFYKTQYA